MDMSVTKLLLSARPGPPPPPGGGRRATPFPEGWPLTSSVSMVHSVALVKLRHFIVESDFDWGGDDFITDFRFESDSDLDVDLASLLEANTMAERDVDRELRYQVLQHEQRIVLSYLQDAGP